jgi:hypothetical protein
MKFLQTAADLSNKNPKPTVGLHNEKLFPFFEFLNGL